MKLIIAMFRLDRAWRAFAWRGLALAAMLLLLVPAAAFAVSQSTSLLLSNKQVWTVIIGALVPLLTYVLNHVGPWISEPIKAAVLVLASAIAGGLYTALATSSFGLNAPTLELVLTSVIASLAAHKLLWVPSGIAAMLGGGSNASPPASRVRGASKQV